MMYAAKRFGVRSILFYAVIGIGGVWIAFLLSHIHATITAVLAAFTIPANVVLKEDDFASKANDSLKLTLLPGRQE